MDKVLSDLKQLESNHFQEELAKTYFSTTPSKENHSTESRLNSKDKKGWRIFFGIVFSLLVVMMVVFFAFNRIAIDIKILPLSKTESIDKSKLADVIYLNKDGDLNRDIIKNIVFYENSNNESNWGRKFILLSNDIASKKAALGIDFIRPLNLKNNLFCFYSKGKGGGEELRISLKDDKNNFCHSKINELQNSWQQFIVDAKEANDFIDLENITHIDLEVNPNEKPNLNRSTIYLKDIYLAKRRE